jgi:hypothetical protein
MLAFSLIGIMTFVTKLNLKNYFIGLLLINLGIVLSFLITYSKFSTYSLSCYLTIFIGYNMVSSTM